MWVNTFPFFPVPRSFIYGFHCGVQNAQVEEEQDQVPEEEAEDTPRPTADEKDAPQESAEPPTNDPPPAELKRWVHHLVQEWPHSFRLP